MSGGGIKIPVQAEFSAASVEQQLQAFQQKLNALGQQIAQANKTQFNPISKTSLQDMQQMIRQFEALRRVSGDLNKRINATGQKGKGFVDLDWNALYPDAHSRARQQAKAWSYVTGHAMVPPAQQPGKPGGGNNQQGPGWVQQAGANAVQAGLRAANGATGGVGGVAANALGTGMSAGFGAGLMGLMGGMLALGVGKLVSAATEKIGQAEDNAVAYDKLKRVLGDVNVSFGALKGVIDGAAQNTKLTFTETARLGSEFAKLGNLTSEQYRGLFDRGGELEVGVGMSRAYGLEPDQGVGVLGRMRGLGVTRNEQDTRRFALLIGETIGKSNAFAKADEVMAAISDYATMQTRSGMGGANVAGYAGMFSSLTASGIPGLDPAGTGALMSRINASLTAGGAKGEASQFFSASVANRMGLDPLQLQVLREGGAFATNDEAFGPGSVAARYGMSGPGGNKTFLSGTLDALRGAYGHDKGLLAQATANHLGINMRQAMAILSVSPNEMGEMGKYADLTKLSGSGIGNLSKALYGSSDERRGLADSLARRTGEGALSGAELARLDDAMQSGDAETQKQVLAELVASRDQERTQGSDIRDSKNLLDNIKTSLADKLIPLTEQMRAGIIYMAGKDGKMTTDQIMRSVIENDSDGRLAAIKNKYDPQRASMMERREDIRNRLDTLTDDKLNRTYRDKPEILAAKLKEREGLLSEYNELQVRIKALEEEKAKLIDKENARRKQDLQDLEEAAEERRKQEEASRDAADKRKKLVEESASSGPGRYSSGGGSVPESAKGSSDAAMKFFMDKGWSKEQAAGIVANLVAESGMRTGAVGDNGKAYGVAQWHPDRQAAFARWSGKDIRGSSLEDQLGFVHHELTAGSDVGARRAGRLLKDAKSAGHSADIVTRHYERPKHVDRDAAHRAGIAEKIGNTPMPDDALAAQRMGDKNMNIRGSFDPLAITLQYPDNKPAAQPIYLTPYFNRPTPFGQSG